MRENFADMIRSGIGKMPPRLTREVMVILSSIFAVVLIVVFAIRWENKYTGELYASQRALVKGFTISSMPEYVVTQLPERIHVLVSRKDKPGPAGPYEAEARVVGFDPAKREIKCVLDSPASSLLLGNGVQEERPMTISYSVAYGRTNMFHWIVTRQ
jgi:hypothetical protein